MDSFLKALEGISPDAQIQLLNASLVWADHASEVQAASVGHYLNGEIGVCLDPIEPSISLATTGAPPFHRRSSTG